MKERLKKIFPIEVNFEIKNWKEYLKKHNKDIEDNERKKIFFLDAASYNNLGDQAIAYAIEKYIKEKFPDRDFIEISEKDFLRNLKYVKSKIKKNDVICLSGGGNMGNLYPRYEAIRRKVIKNFKENRIIIFPQTIDYEDDKYGRRELMRSKKIYNSNPNLIVCARENRSYNIMNKLYANVKLVPDIVLYLYGNICLQKHQTEKYGICLRDDKESIIPKYVKEKIDVLDGNIVNLTTMSKENEINQYNRETILLRKINEFSSCKGIITDRLHGMIFAIISNVPCIAYDNSNRKVSGVFDTIKSKVGKVNIGNEDTNIDFLEEFDMLDMKKNCLSEEIYKELTECF